MKAIDYIEMFKEKEKEEENRRRKEEKEEEKKEEKKNKSVPFHTCYFSSIGHFDHVVDNQAVMTH